MFLTEATENMENWETTFLAFSNASGSIFSSSNDVTMTLQGILERHNVIALAHRMFSS